MKKIIYPIGILAIVFALSSCQDDFLDRSPLSAISSETFWKSEQDVIGALSACYDPLSPVGWEAGFGGLTAQWEALSDDGYTNAGWPSNFPAPSRGLIESTTGGIVRDWYFLNYKAIATCDFFLRNIDSVEKLDETARKQYIGEVRFLRALYYSRLVKVYGGVIITGEVDIDNMDLPKNTREEVVQEVLDDLEYAIANLPNTAYSGRVVKGSALALKARVLMTESRWAEAAQAAKQVIDDQKFSLSEDFAGMFNGQSQDGNPEIIFSSVYTAPDKVSHLDIMYGSWRSCSPLQGLVDAYECTDGKSISESPLFDPENPYENRDPRLDLTIFLPGEPWEYGNGVVDEVFLTTGFAWEKYIDRTQAPVTSTIKSAQDVIILRYADVLLMYAEAKNEADGPDQSVYDALNEVRARTGVDMPAVSGLSKEELRERIRNERRVELAMEGIRYFDLKRWGIAHTVIPQIEDPGVTRIFEQKHYLWPFPQSEIDINDNLVQNDGY